MTTTTTTTTTSTTTSTTDIPIMLSHIGHILTRDQAHALYQTMLVLNDTNATYSFAFAYENGDKVTVAEELDTWAVTVTLATREASASTRRELFTEHYENQAAFALAYGLDVT